MFNYYDFAYLTKYGQLYNKFSNKIELPRYFHGNSTQLTLTASNI